MTRFCSENRSLPMRLSSFPYRQFPGFLEQTKAEVQEFGDARVGDAVVKPASLPPEGDDPAIGQTLQLVGDGLRGHAQLASKVRHAQLASPLECVQEAKAGVVGQHLEKAGELSRLGLTYQRTSGERGLASLRWAPDGASWRLHAPILHDIVESCKTSGRCCQAWPSHRPITKGSSEELHERAGGSRSLSSRRLRRRPEPCDQRVDQEVVAGVEVVRWAEASRGLE